MMRKYAAESGRRARVRSLPRDAGDYRCHLGCTDSRREIKAWGRGEQPVVVGFLPDAGDVVEEAVIVEDVERIEKRIRIADAAVPEAISVCDDRRPERC